MHWASRSGPGYSRHHARSNAAREGGLRNMNRHRPDCSDARMLFELCTYCDVIGPVVNTELAPRTSPAEIRGQAFNALVNSHSSHSSFSPSRTYAQVVRSPSPMFMTHPPTNHRATSHVVQAQTQAQAGASGRGQEFQEVADWIASSSMPQDTSRSYAQVVQQPAQQVSRTHGTPQGKGNARLRATPQQAYLPSSMRSAQSTAKRASPNTASSPPRTQASQSCAIPRSMAPPQASPHRVSLTGSLPQVPAGMMDAALQPERVPNPRDIGAFVQRTERGSQRNPSSLVPGPYPSTPTSPGTLSEASFASTRRTGDARYDPSLPHACNICRHTFKSPDALKRHIRNVHTERPHRAGIQECETSRKPAAISAAT
ncbi:uncharacterized protein MYCFIDRAFT_199442 [Pseudocercospora fijiensis CIRAD86]|uniref:C2H2-type domain-containing protein n=1 Tax=Pseudocercospora fijiensis (strain CIRAD86) TaxID=383855 RepID=M3AQV0_PSEFD|nr:uncharacterized protein MYCFIDRAFT_199442 [Pseudocercospora fijiensis CIRAD86]EME79782.1 hypothetical protein MYCFIDRAFT_199442 [Pseudocercospora fijiensis CIRAD86]